MDRIIVDTRIRKRFFEGKKRDKPPNKIVLHGTAGGGRGGKVGEPGGLYNWMLSGERGEEYKRGVGLFPFLIERDGDIIELLNADLWVYHSGIGAEDSETIGIELVNRKRENAGVYNADQYESLEFLLSILLEKYPIETIWGHSAILMDRRVKVNRTPCPGQEFEWSRLHDYFDRKQIKCVKGNEVISAIGIGSAVA